MKPVSQQPGTTAGAVAEFRDMTKHNKYDQTQQICKVLGTGQVLRSFCNGSKREVQ